MGSLREWDVKAAPAQHRAVHCRLPSSQSHRHVRVDAACVGRAAQSPETIRTARKSRPWNGAPPKQTRASSKPRRLPELRSRTRKTQSRTKRKRGALDIDREESGLNVHGGLDHSRQLGRQRRSYTWQRWTFSHPSSLPKPIPVKVATSASPCFCFSSAGRHFTRFPSAFGEIMLYHRGHFFWCVPFRSSFSRAFPPSPSPLPPLLSKKKRKKKQQRHRVTDESTQADWVRHRNKATMRFRHARLQCIMQGYSCPASTGSSTSTGRDAPCPLPKTSDGPATASLRSSQNTLTGFWEMKSRACGAVRLAGDETVSTSWLVVLRYELEVRREDMKQLHSHGATLTEAFGTGRDK